MVVYPSCKEGVRDAYRGYFELLESLFLELDPLENGFEEVLLEVYRHGDRYVLLEVATATGNRLLRFALKDGRRRSW